MSAPALRLVDADGVVHDDGCPNCSEKDEHIAALKSELERLAVRNARLQKKVNQELGLEPKAAQVYNVWAVYVCVLHPKTKRKKPPADWMKMGLDRAKDFTEEMMVRAVYGANTEHAKNQQTGMVYDEWDNIFRSTGHTRRYMKYADMHDAQRVRRFPRGMHLNGVLRAAGLRDNMRSTDTLTVGSCPACGGDGFKLDIRTGVYQCAAGCEHGDVDPAFARLAAAYGLAP